MQVMQKTEAEKRKEYMDHIRPMSDKRFQHFATEQQKQDHLAHVERHKHSTPF